MIDRRERNWSASLAGWAVFSAFHLTMVAIFSVALGWLIAPLEIAWWSYKLALAEEAFRSTTLVQTVLHVGLSACLWAMLYLVGSYLVTARDKTARTIRVSRGTAMTETLIVIPVFLLLCFGLAQLAINNIAGILANVAVYQAARSAWVWKGEEGVTRVQAVSSGEARDRARIAAALVMTPVAPGEFWNNPTISDQAASRMRDSLAKANIPLVGAAVPSSVVNVGTNVFGTGLKNPFEETSFVAALDTSHYAVRGIRKYTHAWHATSVRVTDSANGDTSVRLRYRHFVAMPLMGRLFGNLNVVGLRPGHYSTFNRTYGFKSLSKTPPNPKLPSGTLLDGVINGMGFGAAIRDEVGDF